MYLQQQIEEQGIQWILNVQKSVVGTLSYLATVSTKNMQIATHITSIMLLVLSFPAVQELERRIHSWAAQILHRLLHVDYNNLDNNNKDNGNNNNNHVYSIHSAFLGTQWDLLLHDSILEEMITTIESQISLSKQLPLRELSLRSLPLIGNPRCLTLVERLMTYPQEQSRNNSDGLLHPLFVEHVMKVVYPMFSIATKTHLWLNDSKILLTEVSHSIIFLLTNYNSFYVGVKFG
jgi:hypothetical protein